MADLQPASLPEEEPVRPEGASDDGGATDGALAMEVEPDAELREEGEGEGATEGEGEGEGGGDGAGEPGHEGKRVKVYELRESSWFDRGTGYCKGVYDDTQDLALLIVEAELSPEKADEPAGGFLKEELLLSARVEKDDIYARQQDTLIVWTEPQTQLDIALSFQDAEGCEDIWTFIAEVQRHLNNLPGEGDQLPPSSSSPVLGSPVLGMGAGSMSGSGDGRAVWQAPTLANIKEQELLLRMQAKSAQGRERAVEHILGEEYIRQLIAVFDQAEDLESLEDLHALCSLMQTILMFNDNGIFEYILQDGIFQGVIGMLEYDPDFPTLKASYREFFEQTAKFREVIEIRDSNIRSKIHQTYRLLFLKDVVLARVLDDPTFGILNGFVFFNQVDITNYFQGNTTFLVELFGIFAHVEGGEASEERVERRRDATLFLHQLMLMGKGVQVPNRLALYRNLLDRGLLRVCEWAFQRKEAQLLHAGAEILTLAVEHDVNAVRGHVLKEEEARAEGKVKGRGLILEMIELMSGTKNLGVLSQMGDTIRTMIDMGEVEGIMAKKEAPIGEGFITYFYDNCVAQLYKPLFELPEIKSGVEPPKFPRERLTLLQHLVELLSFSIANIVQSHRACFYILSNPISKKITSLLYLRDKPLRHAALRFVKACFRIPNHFVHRYYVKNDLLVPVLDLLEEESTRDNMLSSACMDVLDLIRKENLKLIINYLFDTSRPRLEALSHRPYLRSFIHGLTLRWEQNNEPPPAPIQPLPQHEGEASGWARKEQEEWFDASDEEEIGPKPPASVPAKRKRMQGGAGTRPSFKPKRKLSALNQAPSKGGGASAALGLDYDDASDDSSEGSGQSPKSQPISSPVDASDAVMKEGSEIDAETKVEELEEDLGEVQMRMRAKRQKEEEEDEGFAGLLVKAGQLGGEGVKAVTTPKKEGPGGGGIGGEKRSDTPRGKDKDEGGGGGGGGGAGRRIRLSLGSLGKKLGGGGAGK